MQDFGETMLGILGKIGFIPIVVATIVIGGLISWMGGAPFFSQSPQTGKPNSNNKPVQNGAFIEPRRIVQICKSSECLEMDRNLMEKIDQSIDPCYNFYEYVCDSYAKSTQATNFFKLDEIHAAQKSIVSKLFQIVQEPIADTDIKALKITKQMYRGCLDSHVEEFKNFIKYIGGWSLLDDEWNEADFTLDKFYARCIEKGYFPTSLFVIGITPDLKNNSRNTVFITQAKTSDDFASKIFRTKWPLKSTILDEGNLVDYLMKSFAAKISEKLGINRLEVQKQLVDYIKLFGLIYAIYIEDAETPRVVSGFYNVMTLAQMETTYSNIPWSGIIRGIFKPVQISSDEKLIVTCPQCLLMLNTFVGNVPKKSLVNFLIWSLIIDKIVDVDSEMLNAWLLFNGQSKAPKDLIVYKETFCANEIFNLFRRVMDYEYVNRHFDKGLQRKVSNFVGMLKGAMKDVINSNSLMDEKTKAYAVQKVDSMVIKVAYDDEINSKNKVNEYYEELYISDPKQYFAASLNLTKFIISKAVKEFRKPAKIDYLSATSGNAAYALLNNAIFLSASVLGGLLFSKNRPEYLNFGALGFVVGHEMNHGFDVMGRSFDMRGSLNNWWQAETEANYWKKVNCFVHQYSEFVNVETGNKVNGNLTLSENLADNGGIQVAYKAYVKWLNTGKEELPLPSFQQFTPHQMFWISFASITCSKISHDIAVKREQTDVHALNRIRVNGVVSNNEDFAKDFRCRPGTPMNPKKKCTVWS